MTILTTNVSGHVEKNLLVKHSNIIADSERAWKVVLEFFIGAEQTSFRSYYKFGQKWPIIEMVKTPYLTNNGLICSFLIGFV